MATNSDVQICNMALGFLGHKRFITSLGESSVEARILNMYFAAARDDVLQEHEWNFATKDASLAPIDEAIEGWSYLYARPPGCLYIRSIHAQASLVKAEFEEVQSPSTNQRAIATDMAAAFCRFTVSVTDPNLFTPNFTMALAYKLAIMASKSITGSNEPGNACIPLYRELLQRAKTANRSEKKSKQDTESSFINAR